MDIGDIVARKSYGCDLYFIITGINHDGSCILRGIDYRLKVSAPLWDLEPVMASRIREFKNLFKGEIELRIAGILEKRNQALDRSAVSVLPGKILHVDADREYLKMCMSFYKKLEMDAYGEQVKEEQQPESIGRLLPIYMPDILVITGHDSLRVKEGKDVVGNYKSSRYFIDTVKAARQVNPSKDSLVIIAGACQSFYEGLIEAGANIASSPQRILIHALDPLFAAEKVAYGAVDRYLGISEILENNITGTEGMGGYQTRGTCRIGLKT